MSSLSREKLQQYRSRYFGQNRDNVQTDAIFPSFQTGPRYIRDRKDDVPSGWTDLKRRCEDALKRPKKEEVVVTIDALLSQILEDYTSFGVALHLLPLYPFGFLNTVLTGDKFARQSLAQNIVVTLVIEDLLRRSNTSSSQWVNVYPESSYTAVLEHEAGRRGLRVLPDPLSSGSDSEDEWCRHLLLVKDGDRPFQTDRVMGQYLCDKTTFCQSMHTMLNNLRRYLPHCISDPNKPLEFNAVVRLKMATKCFGYDYTIERVHSTGILFFGGKDGERNTIFEPSRHRGFIRVPRGLGDDVDSFLRQKHGLVSVTTLVQHLQTLFRDKNNDVTSKGIIWLIRQLTHFQNDDDEDDTNMQVTPKHHWIFFYKTKSGDESLPVSELVFKACNLKRHLCRSFGHCERKNGALQMDATKYKSFLKDTVIGFPYPCDMNDREDVTQMCNHRFLTEREKLLHIQRHHGLTREEEEILKKLLSTGKVLENIKMKGEAKWLEEMGLLGKTKEKDLIGMENLGDLFLEFSEQHSVLVQAVILIRETFVSCKKAIDDARKKMMDAAKKTNDVTTRTRLHGEVLALDRIEKLFERCVHIQESMLLPREEFDVYVTAWTNVIHRQCSVLQKFNRATEKIQSARIKGSRMANIIIQDWKKEVGQAGINLGTLKPDTLAQKLNSDFRVRDERDYAVLLLAMVSQLADHEERVSKHVVGSYLKQMNEDDASDDEMNNVGGRDGRKRHLHDKDDNRELYKMMKMKEATMEDDEMMDVSQFQNTFQKFQEKKCVVHIDSRHLDLDDMKKFVGGRKMLPGSEIVQVGKGSCDAVDTYELVDPTTIQVDLNDYRDLIFYLLCVMRDQQHVDHVAFFVEQVKSAIMSLLNVMFALSMQGQEMVEGTLKEAIESKSVTAMGFMQIREQLWMFFLAIISFLNGNRSGELNPWFALRFSRHGDASMVPVKMLPDVSTVYELKEDVRRQMEKKRLFLLAFMCHCTRDMLDMGGSCLVKVDNVRFFGTQADLIQRIRNRYKQDIALFHENHTSELQLVSVKDKPMSKTISHITPSTPTPHSSVPILKTIDALMEDKEKRKQRSGSTRCYDNVPSHTMEKDDLRLYDNEINNFRMQLCCICREPFSNRPLEGLNCVYKEAERQFRASRSLDDTIVLDDNPDLLRDYWHVVSQKMEKSDDKTETFVDANGMHLFHRECLRRYIQLAALDTDKPAIECPVCKTEVYSHAEKKVIRGNINEIACRLALAADNERISLHSTDTLINLKRNATTFGNDPFVRYFPAGYLEEKASIREDAALVEEMEMETTRHVSKMKMEVGESKVNDVVNKYIDITLKKDSSDFCLKKVADLIHA